MRAYLLTATFACLPTAALADSVRTIEVFNHTDSRIVSFSIAPAGSDRWTEVAFDNPKDPPFDYGIVVTLQLRDDGGCLRDFRTELFGGREIVAHNFDLCHFHAYLPGRRFRGSRPGSQIVP